MSRNTQSIEAILTDQVLMSSSDAELNTDSATPEKNSSNPRAKILKTHKSLWISDVHLGTGDCQAEALLDFLAHNEAQTIYLVGDIIDGWQLKKRWYWPQTHNDVIQKLLRKARKGTRIVYVTGNHDMFIRDYITHLSEPKHGQPKFEMGGIEFVDEIIHTTVDGRKIWILHGDLFDGVVQNMRWLAKIGDELYMVALKFNRWLNHWRAKLGLEYWSLSQFLKDRVKNAVSYIDDFETAVAAEAQRKGCQAVLCGHIHKANIRDINGVTYLNTGDWVESLTAISEDFSGALSIIEWGQVRHLSSALTSAPVVQPNAPVDYLLTPAQAAFAASELVSDASESLEQADGYWERQASRVINTTKHAYIGHERAVVRT